MAKPIIKWLDKNLADLSLLRFTSKAGAYEPVIAEQASVTETIYIANNFTKDIAAGEAVDDAVNCYLKVTDRSGTANSPVISEAWTRAKCVTDSTQSDFTQIGVIEEQEITIHITAGDQTRPNTISGAANDGNIASGAQYNAAKVELFVQPPLSTTANGGVQQFRYVLVYSYGAAA